MQIPQTQLLVETLCLIESKKSNDEYHVEQMPFCDHLDCVGQEFMRSFGDEIIFHQGQGRQNKGPGRKVKVFYALLGLEVVLIAIPEMISLYKL